MNNTEPTERLTALEVQEVCPKDRPTHPPKSTGSSMTPMKALYFFLAAFSFMLAMAFDGPMVFLMVLNGGIQLFYALTEKE
jgi:hypothetical protein